MKMKNTFTAIFYLNDTYDSCGFDKLRLHCINSGEYPCSVANSPNINFLKFATLKK